MNPIGGQQNGLYFTVSTAVIDDSRKLGKAIRDKDGYFTDVPVAVLGKTTRNKTNYDTESFVNLMRGPDSTFNCRLTEGVLIGEWSHPFVDLNSQAGMTRLLHLEPAMESHHIRSVSVKNISDLGLDLVVMDAKGTGPYGSYYDSAMLDPTRNLAHSLRGISDARFDRATGIVHKKLRALVTFDAGMAGGGFKEASKRYMASVEDLKFETTEVLSVPVTDEHLVLMRTVALESFTNTELNDILQAKKVVIGTTTTGFVDRNSQSVIDPETGSRRSIFRTFSTVKNRS